MAQTHRFLSLSAISPQFARLEQPTCSRWRSCDPSDKKLELALQRIHGIGRSKSHKIRVDLNLENKATRDLTGFELNKLDEEVSNYMIEWELMIDCYRGIRHQSGLPRRGQRTHANNKTVKKKKTGTK